MKSVQPEAKDSNKYRYAFLSEPDEVLNDAYTFLSEN